MLVYAMRYKDSPLLSSYPKSSQKPETRQQGNIIYILIKIPVQLRLHFAEIKHFKKYQVPIPTCSV